MQGATNHIGRLGDVKTGNEIKKNLDDKMTEKQESNLNEVDKLKEDLKNAIKEERYEDAAKIRDELKKHNEE